MTCMTSLLLAGAVIAAGTAAVAAVAAMPEAARPTPGLAIGADAAHAPLWLASGGGDDDEDGRRAGRGGDDDDDEEDDDGCDDDAGGACAAGAGPAPAGSVAPPANGLFGSGAAPQVQVR